MSDDLEPATGANRIRATFDWTFRSRKTGRITIAQFPNWSLSIFLVGSLARRSFHPTGTARSFVAVMVAVSLGWWALDEIIRGVNPWRRCLGATVLAVLIVGGVSQ